MLIKENDPNRKVLEVLAVYQTVFGVTPIERRCADIKEEADELVNYTSDENLREELGDLLTSCYCLVAERGWSIDDLIKENLSKIRKRFNEGHYHKTGEAISVESRSV